MDGAHQRCSSHLKKRAASGYNQGMETTAPFDWFGWVGLPLLIFAARIVDVSLGTLRIILVARGRRRIAPLLGFLEVLIWITAISQIMRGAQTFTAYLGYAAGFAAGNYVGMALENRLALGRVIVRAILASGGEEMVARLRQAGFGVTCVHGEGAHGPVLLIYTIVERRDLPAVSALMHAVAPKAFITVEDLRSVEAGVFPTAGQHRNVFQRQKSK